jgi:ribosomal protein S18/ribosomal protein S6
MANYEFVVVFNEQATDEAKAATVARVEAAVKKAKGSVETEQWGRRVLAYDIDDKRNGVYTLFKIEAEGVDFPKLEYELSIDDAVLRFMNIRVGKVTKVERKTRDGDLESFEIDYKKPDVLVRFVTERGKIVPRRISKFSASEQRALAREVKRARMVALLPFTTQGQ